MSNFRSEKAMSSVTDFVSERLRKEVAPIGSAPSVKARINLAARRMGWSVTRTRDIWYADPRVSIGADEIKDIETKTGINYGREEYTSVNDILAKAEALMEGHDPDFHSAFVFAMRAVFGIVNRT